MILQLYPLQILGEEKKKKIYKLWETNLPKKVGHHKVKYRV